MGRLIDADALYEKLQNDSSYDLDFFDAELRQIIEGTPTAYDVEKVVTELERATKYVTINGKNTGLEALHPIQAINIVKRGGIE